MSLGSSLVALNDCGRESGCSSDRHLLDEIQVNPKKPMNQQLWALVYLAGYFLVFLTAVIGVGIWFTKRHRGRPPLEFKLLRGPGESLRQRMNQFDEDIIERMGALALAPVVAVLVTGSLLIWLTPHLKLTYGLAIMAVVAAPVLFFAGRQAVRILFRRADDRLGYLGERAVGDALVPLASAGYRVFHDIPAENGKAKFNIDHVAVGPNGLFAIETKTRRKGRARPGFEAHKVVYDGKRLIWPWTEDTFGLEQAEARARWLGDWLNKLTGLGLAAQPVLVLPGWYVVPKGLGSVIVLNHKQVASVIARGSARVLTDAQIDLIARQLDERCRDVED